MTQQAVRHWTHSQRAPHGRIGIRAVAAQLPRWLSTAVLLLAAGFFTSSARATVELRVVAQPINLDVQTFVTVTDGNGDPVPGLTAGDFTVTLDGNALSISGFTKPPSEDPSQHVSVIFVMDYSSSIQNVARVAMESAVSDFINAMNDGDFAAIIKFNVTSGVSLVREFTAIDHDVGTAALIAAVGLDHPGEGSPILDAVNLAINHFIATFGTLPPGPKSIIVITDGGENNSAVTQSAVVDNANGNSIPIFTIGVGNVSGVNGLALLTNLADRTGGDYVAAPDDAAIADAYATISRLLSNEYLLTIPTDLVTGCGLHTLEVSVTGQAPPPASVTFSRCDTTPDPFSFANQTGVTPNATVTSNAVTISGITGPAQISVAGGEYSIGCNSATFRSSDSMVVQTDTVCVRHTASVAFNTAKTTTLTVGGVSGAFTSTTKGPPPKSGGGGAIGMVEILFGLGALLARRRRRA
jgi:VWFA-related protein